MATEVPTRLLLGSGPSPVPERVMEALALPTVGHLDPVFGEVMDETAELLRRTFRTANRATLPVSATGSGGMDALVVNFVAPGDRVVVGVNGLFGERMADAMERAGAHVVRVDGEWGRAIPPERLIDAAADGLDAMFVVHGETSTGVCQPLDGLAEACRERDALLLVDCVTSLAGQPLDLDAAGVDAAFSGTQKCLNCPPGLAPFTAGERAIAKLRAREDRPRSWYFDLSLVLGYWDGESGRAYHHTAPINMVYALREALRIVQEEGLEARWERHARAHEALRAALAELGLERLAHAAARRDPFSPTASSSTRCSPSACRRAWTRRPCGAGCCSSTTSRSPAASARSPGGSGGSASWASAPPRSPSAASSRRSARCWSVTRPTPSPPSPRPGPPSENVQQWPL